MERRSLYWRFSRFLERHLPSGLYKRALLIVILPFVLLQTIMTGIILDRHWDQVTRVLSRSLSREISMLIDLYDHSDKSAAALAEIERVARERLLLDLKIESGAKLPDPLPQPFFSPVDIRLNRYLERDTKRPFWVDTRGLNGRIDIRIEASPGLVFHVLAPDERAQAPGTVVLLYAMIGSSLVLLAIAVVFLRNQITPILQLAKATRDFGLGRNLGDFYPRGAKEVREASEAFLNMKARIERHVEQRTAMLAGVSHDLRTVLTRFKLELAFLGDTPQVRALKDDVDEMQRMLEAYLAFAQGAEGEPAEPIEIGELLASVAKSVRADPPVNVSAPGGLLVRIKPNAFRRLLANLIGNATRYAKTVKVGAASDGRRLRIAIDDDGPGIPPERREDVFKPFVRLDHARNLDETGTGLGLAIARDIARAHGGDIALDMSPLGGLRATVEVPV
jgi:two-component system osmolarity sensor histidine kinase EnvZ